MNLIQNFFQDIRVGFRVLVKERSFCALAVLVFALGIGAVTTQFSVVNGAALRGLSFPNGKRMMSIQFVDPSPTKANPFGANQIFALDYEEISAQQKSFERVAAYINGATVNLTYNGNPTRYTGAYVTEDFLHILGVAPVIGRDFSAADNLPGAPKTTIISHKLWQRDFGSKPDIVGTSVLINSTAATVIGVMEPGFSFPGNDELWIPLFAEFAPKPRNDRTAAGGAPQVIGLIRPDVGIDRATAEITVLAQRLATEFPETNTQFNSGLVQPMIKALSQGPIINLLYVMLGVCAIVLLLACANVMNMQFARATLRAKELAIRSSLGATRSRLVCQMLTESLLLATVGAVFGVLLAVWATDLVEKTARNLTPPVPSYISFSIDGWVLAVVAGCTVLSAVISGIIPAWMASRPSASEMLKESGRGNTSSVVNLVTRSLVVAQIMFTCLILLATILELKSIVRQQVVNYGYNTEALMTARMALMDGEYPNSAKRKLFYDRLLHELRASPEIESVALTNRLRMAFVPTGPARIEIEGKVYNDDRDRPFMVVENISDGYFDTLGVKLREGRDFRPDDSDAKLPVAIVTADFARKQFGAESAIGRRFRTTNNKGQTFGPWRTIVGVVDNLRMNGPFPNFGLEDYGFFIPYYATAFGPAATEPVAVQFATVIVRPRGESAAAFGTRIQKLVNRIDPNLPLYFVGTAANNQATFLGQNRIIGTMFSIFGAVAVLLAAVGLYGVMSFSVNQRTQEFGIRMALGADNHRILKMVMRQGSLQLAFGLGIGLGIALLLVTLFRDQIENLLFQISPSDPATYLSVAALLSAVAALACLIPARRATRVDPMIALRAE
jgi:putative ABC transport system permease protein